VSGGLVVLPDLCHTYYQSHFCVEPRDPGQVESTYRAVVECVAQALNCPPDGGDETEDSRDDFAAAE
jgi:hypothetical protein